MLINILKNIYRATKLNSTVLSDFLLVNSLSTYGESFVNNSNLSSIWFFQWSRMDVRVGL